MSDCKHPMWKSDAEWGNPKNGDTKTCDSCGLKLRRVSVGMPPKSEGAEQAWILSSWEEVKHE